MNKKDEKVLKVANKYVTELRSTGRVELWRDYWKQEGKVLQERRSNGRRV